ncbi:MAG: hypothetical protein LC687_02685, partial [Actinobacteria bacterium]|nr:hypothetical protein [Actinomycetota bacterium]
LIDPTDLSSNVKLSFFIAEGATLTMSAEEVHEYLAENAIDLGDGSGGTSPGTLVITDAGFNFDASDAGAVGPDGLPIDGGGTITGATNNLVIERSADGYDRPSQQPIDDKFVIDSTDGPVVVGPNDFAEDDELSLPQETTTLLMQGDNDITFEAPVSFEGTEGFTIDFSEVEGTVSGLEIVIFNDIAPPGGGGNKPLGEVIGNNNDARIDVQLKGAFAPGGQNTLVSSGVATYVVTSIEDVDAAFWVTDTVEDLEVLGLQGNAGGEITFKEVRNGVSFLMEGDGLGDFTEVPIALNPIDESNIGTLVAEFAAGSGTVNAVVDINNQGVELGAASDGGERELYVDGIVINNAQSITLNISDGDADIGGQQVTSGVAGVQGDILEDLIINNVDDVTLTVDDSTSSLESLDASGVDGTMTLLVLDGSPVDLSGTTLTGIDAIEMEASSDLTLTVEQALDIGIGNVSVEEGAGPTTLTLNVTEDFNIDDLDVANLPEGLTLELSLQSEVELNITGDQLVALEEAGVAITDGSDPSDPDDLGTVNITDVNQTHMIDGSAVIPAALAGAWELEGGTLGLTEQSMADGLVVNNGDIQFFFVPSTIANPTGDPINASDYTAIGTVSINEFGLPATYNIESITNLDENTEVEIVPLVPVEFDGVDRTLIVGGVPFAINEDGTPFNPASGDAGPVTTGVNLLFSNVSGDPDFNVENVTIVFEEGGNIIGDIIIGVGELPEGNVFETLTLISNGDNVNTIQDISAPSGNNLLEVTIDAREEFSAQTITLSSREPDADGVVTITGDADVTLKAIDYTTDPDVDTLTVITSGYTGTLDITGGSPSITTGEELTFVGGEDSTVLLDTDDLEGTDNGYLGVDGNGELTLIDASGMAGTLALGDVDNVADGFELIGGTGVITANILALPTDNWSLDISDAAASSQIDTTLGSLTSGSLALSTDEDDGTTTLTFGDDTTHVANGPLDLSGFDNVVFGENVEFVLGEGGLVLMSDD